MAGLGSKAPGSPVSLVAPQAEDAADRRAYKLIAANSAPGTTTRGFHTKNKRWLHIEVLLTAGTSANFTLYTRRNNLSDTWSKDTRLGTAGVVTVTTAGGLYSVILEIDGIDFVALLVDTLVGPPANVDVWLGSSGDVDGR